MTMVFFDVLHSQPQRSQKAMSSRPLIKDSLFLLNISGINPYKSNAWTNLRTVLIATVVLICWLNLLRELTMHWESSTSMAIVPMFAGLYQLISEYTMIMLHRKKLAKIINNFEGFWSIDICSLELKKEIESSLAFMKRCVQFLGVMLMVLGTAFAIISLFEGKLPLGAKYPIDTNVSPNYELVYLVELAMIVGGAFAILGVSSLFLALIINIACELKILREGFQKLPIDQELRDESDEDLLGLYKMIDHHIMIIESITEIQEVYSIYLLNVYFYSTACIGIALLCIVASGFPPTFDSLAQYGSLGLFYVFNLFFYCASGTYLTSECEQISAAVYEMNWWIKTQPRLRKACVVILTRANKAETLSAGGIFILNLDSFTKVMRLVMNNTFSLFTLAETMYEN